MTPYGLVLRNTKHQPGGNAKIPKIPSPLVSGLKQCLNSCLLDTNSLLGLWSSRITCTHKLHTITKVNFDFTSTFEHSPTTSCSKYHSGFLESLCMSTCRKTHMLPAFSTTARLQKTFAVNPHGFLGTTEGHVNASSRAYSSHFFIRNRGLDGSRGYERHMGWRE